MKKQYDDIAVSAKHDMGELWTRNELPVTVYLYVGDTDHANINYETRGTSGYETHILYPKVDGKPWPSDAQPPEPGETPRDLSADDLRKFDRLVLHLSNTPAYKGHENDILRGLAIALPAAIHHLDCIGTAASAHQVTAQLWIKITNDATLIDLVATGDAPTSTLVAVCAANIKLHYGQSNPKILA